MTPLTLATLYADTLDPPTPLANPFTADPNDGYFDFYAANGHYDVQLSGGTAGHEIVTPYSWGDVLMQDVGSGILGVTQAQLGGSRAVSPDVQGANVTLEAVEYLDVLVPWTQLPVGAVVNLVASAQAPAGGGPLNVELYDLTSAAVVLFDPTPFIDDTQFVTHLVPLVRPVPDVDQTVRLRAQVQNGDQLPCFFLGALWFS